MAKQHNKLSKVTHLKIIHARALGSKYFYESSSKMILWGVLGGRGHHKTSCNLRIGSDSQSIRKQKPACQPFLKWRTTAKHISTAQ
eukprot:3251339-Amphidinium_carterae.1